MLAALLLNEPYPGAVHGRDREKRIVDGLRKDYFEGQKEGRKISEAVEISPLKMVYQIPVLPEIAELDLPGATAEPGDRVDEELAFLLIIAEL